jgi:hypothetical protein
MKMDRREVECEGNIQSSLSTSLRLTGCLVLVTVLSFVTDGRHRNT